MVSGVQMCFGILHKKFISEIWCDAIDSLRGNYYDRLKKKIKFMVFLRNIYLK